MLKIHSLLSALFLTIAFAHVSAQSTLPDSLEIITPANASQIEQIAEINYGTGAVRFVSWSLDGTRFAVVRASEDGEIVEIWDIQDLAFPETPKVVLNPTSVDRIRWLPDNQSLVIHSYYPSDDGVRVRVDRWDANSGEVLEILLDDLTIYLNGETPLVSPILGWNSDYTQSATFIDQNTFQLSDGSSFSGDYGEFGTILQVDWSPDDQYISVLHVTGYEFFRFEILDAETLEIEMNVDGGDDYYVYDIVWSPDSTSFAIVSIDEGVFVRNTNIRPYRIGEEVCYGSCERRFAVKFPENYVPNITQPMGISWSPDSQMLAISAPDTLNIFDVETLAEIAVIAADNLSKLDWHPSGRLIVTGTTDGTIQLWGVPSD